MNQSASAAVADVYDVLSNISEAWQLRQYDKLASHFDPDMTIVSPGFERRVQGRAACVDSYREFMDRATIERYEEAVPVVDVWGDTAVATYRWEMAWTAEGTADDEAGHDIVVLRRSSRDGVEAWRVVWRAVTSEKSRGERGQNVD
jgi:ketosteroid isomerase-like protein